MRLLHTMIRVGELERSLRFYCEMLGMKLLSRKDYPGGRFTLAFVGYGDEASDTVIELTHNWDTDRYETGDGFGHLAIGVDDIYGTCDDLRARGVPIGGGSAAARSRPVELSVRGRRGTVPVCRGVAQR